ncbi:hypothetical protein ABZ069_38070 [Streptomyces microflavus]|uniref:hypothetical protein n=1 Tax=Streptomyces microflavus TaxID=1919 RepID=UPI0033B47DE1
MPFVIREINEGFDDAGNFYRAFQWVCDPAVTGFILQETWLEERDPGSSKVTNCGWWEAWQVVGGIVHDSHGNVLTDKAHAVWQARFGSEWALTGRVYWAGVLSPLDAGFTAQASPAGAEIWARGSGDLGIPLHGLTEHSRNSSMAVATAVEPSSVSVGATPGTTAAEPVYTPSLAYHGTTPACAGEISRHGFLLSAQVANGRRYGDGIYFTENEKSARGWSRGDHDNPEKGKGPVFTVSLRGSIADVNEREVSPTLKARDFSRFPFAQTDTEKHRLTELLTSQKYAGSTSPMVSVGTFLREKGYSGMYLRPWKEIIIFDPTTIEIINIDGPISAEPARVARGTRGRAVEKSGTANPESTTKAKPAKRKRKLGIRKKCVIQ